jgi:Ca2+-binding EF-hand superfamily protein
MLGYESERRLKNFLVAVGDGERDLENARARLCNIRDFAPNSAFQRLDRDYSGYVTAREICNFLRDNSVYHVSESEAYTLVQFFDSNGDGRLTYQEFIQMVLPCEDNYLRNVTLDRYAVRVGRYDHLPRDIELALTSVIEKEIDLQRRLESLKRDMQLQYDYSPFAAFRSIDRYNSGRIDSINVGSFLRQNGHYSTEMENLAIVRRIDTDGDACVVYSEWAEFVRSAFPSPRPSTPPRALSASRGNSSPLKSSSPARASSANRTAGRTSSSPIRGVSPSRTSPTRKPVLRLSDEDQLIHGLKDQCNLEQELENAKIALAQKHDFNIRDAFDIFDVPRYGQIDAYQIRSGLNAIGVYPTSDEVDLFITRYDRDGNRRLSYHEFAEAFLAHDGYYRSMVDRRPSNYTPRPIRRDDCFLPNTAFEFQNMWRTHIRVENASESFRQSLARNPGFNCYEAFNSLDLSGVGSINASDLKRMIESRGYFVSFREVDAVIDKFDRNHNKEVSFSEFRDETLPKSPARR